VALSAGPSRAAPSDLADRAVDISRHRGNEAETAVAINPVDPDNVVVFSNATIPALVEAVTFDGGVTWVRRRLAVGVACCDPSLTFDRFGNLFLVYLANGGNAIRADLSTDGGATF